MLPPIVSSQKYGRSLNRNGHGRLMKHVAIEAMDHEGFDDLPIKKHKKKKNMAILAPPTGYHVGMVP